MERVKQVFLYFFSWRILTLLIASITALHISFREEFTAKKYGEYLPYLLNVWANFDGYHYMEIAERGYAQFEQPFFPFYPILINLFSRIFDWPYLFSGVLISNVCFVLALVVLYKLLILDKKNNLISLFFLVIILYPTSMFYGAVYNDSLFLFLASLTLYLGRKRNFWGASITGALASLTRVNGLALFFFLLIEALWPHTKHLNLKKNIRAKWKWSFLSFLLIPLAFMGYWAYTYLDTGANLLFTSKKATRGEDIILLPQVFWRYLKIFLLNSPTQFTYWIAALEFLNVAFYVFIIFNSFKKIRPSYWTFMLVSFTIPTLTGTFSGMPRYALHIYPFFLATSLFLFDKKLIIKMVYFAVSFGLMWFYIGYFTRGYFVA